MPVPDRCRRVLHVGLAVLWGRWSARSVEMKTHGGRRGILTHSVSRLPELVRFGCEARGGGGDPKGSDPSLALLGGQGRGSWGLGTGTWGGKPGRGGHTAALEYKYGISEGKVGKSLSPDSSFAREEMESGR